MHGSIFGIWFLQVLHEDQQIQQHPLDQGRQVPPSKAETNTVTKKMEGL